MQIGFAVPNGPPTANPRDLIRLVTEGESMGFDYATFSDHVVIPNEIATAYPYSKTGKFPERASHGHHEQLTAMGFVAGATTTLRLVTSVMVVPYRPAVLTAKMIATLDVLSGGRVTLGVGTGWMTEEFEALGVPFGGRGRLTDEYLDAFVAVWQEDNPYQEGECVTMKNISLDPKPVQDPHPPIWVGGMAKAAIRRAARIGQAWYPVLDDPKQPLDSLERCRAALQDLGDLAAAAGRDRDSVNLALRVTHTGDRVPSVSVDGGRRIFSGGSVEIADDLAQLREMGVRGVDFRFDSESLQDDTSVVLARMEAFQHDVLSRLGSLVEGIPS